jgi:hypothetical protein
MNFTLLLLSWLMYQLFEISQCITTISNFFNPIINPIIEICLNTCGISRCNHGSIAPLYNYYVLVFSFEIMT